MAPIGSLDDLIGAGSIASPDEYNALLDTPPVSKSGVIPTGVDLLAKPVLHEIFREPVEQIQIGAWGGRESTGKIKMMIRVSQPHERGEEHVAGERFPDATDDLPQ